MVHIYMTSDKAASESYTLADTAKDDQLLTITASKPWSVLIPAGQHQIKFLDRDIIEPAEIAAIKVMRMETDFVIMADKEKMEVLQRHLRYRLYQDSKAILMGSHQVKSVRNMSPRKKKKVKRRNL